MKRLLALLLAFTLLAPATASADTPFVINPFSGGFVFGSGFSADNSGSPYWNHLSADGERCNFSYFATGAIVAGTCANALPGSDANATSAALDANPYSWWHGHTGAYSFAPGPYAITLMAGYRGLASDVFTYTCVGAACSIAHNLSETVGTTAYVAYGGAITHWGFFYSNNFNPSAGCTVSQTSGYCSGINDGTALPTPGSMPQFWAVAESDGVCSFGLFCYLVGLEDNRLEKLPNENFYDGDYNDYIYAVTPTPEPSSMALIATGLVGMVGAGWIRRRRERQH